jgi:hypothetical protein
MSMSEFKNIEVYNSLLSGIDSRWRGDLISIFDDVCLKYDHLFKNSIWYTENIVTKKRIIEYVLPTVRKVWANFFIIIPNIIDPDYGVGQMTIPFDDKIKEIKSKKLELYKLSFDLGEFLEMMVNKFTSLIEIIRENFNYIDIYSSCLNLIVDEYISSKVKFCTESDNLIRDIRDLKIKKIL